MDLWIVAIAQRFCVSASPQRPAFLAVAATLAMLACGGSQQSELAPSPVSSSAVTAKPSTFSVSGTVRGATGPLPDAHVGLEGLGHYNTRTDTEGAYRFSQ